MTDFEIDMLASITGTTPRQVRYLIAEGFVPPLLGESSTSTYSDDHVTAIRRFSRLRSLGFPPSAIRLLLDACEGFPVPIGNGLTLVIAPELIGSGGDVPGITAKAAAKVEVLLSQSLPEDQTHAAR